MLSSSLNLLFYVYQSRATKRHKRHKMICSSLTRFFSPFNLFSFCALCAFSRNQDQFVSFGFKPLSQVCANETTRSRNRDFHFLLLRWFIIIQRFSSLTQ